MNVVTEGLMEIYQRLLGLKFNKLTGGEVWHEDVELFQVDDATSGENLGKQIRTKAVKSFPCTTRLDAVIASQKLRAVLRS